MSKIIPSLQALELRLSPATFTVTKLADDGTAGTLRFELAAADTSPGLDKIVFKLPAPAAHSENTILLAGTELTSKGNVTIIGPGAGKLIINAGGASRVFHIDDTSAATDSPTTISGLSIINGVAGGVRGGGVYSVESLSLKNVVISQCSAGSGGGVAVNDFAGPPETVNITNSFVTDNSATATTGGIDVFGLKAILIKKTVVTGNMCTGGTGGIYAGIRSTGTGIAIMGCTIDGNSAASPGGLYLQDAATSPKAKITISGTTIANNSATGGNSTGGGGMWLASGNAVITGSTIRNNSAVYYGGGVTARYLASLTISKTTIAGNRTTATNGAGQGGGGIFIKGTGAATPEPVTIKGSSITDNSSARYGGGLFAENGIALTISSSSFAGNRATNIGGGLADIGTGANKVDLTVTASTFANNSAAFEGGLEASGDGRIAISSSKLTGNVATSNSGATYLTSTAATNGVILKNVTVSGNVAGGNGGGVIIGNTADFHISGGSFTNNQAANGGGIELVASAGSIVGTTISGNDAAGTGGGIYQTGAGTVTVQAAKVFGNTATTDPDFFGIFTFV
jgi:hypothetical protein